MAVSTPDLRLKPIKGSRRVAYQGQTVVAVVSFDPYDGGRYNHTHVGIGTLCKDGTYGRASYDTGFTFQRNTDHDDRYFTPARGFLAGPRPLSTSYAKGFKTDFDGAGDVAFAGLAMRLHDRAMQALRDRFVGTGRGVIRCQMLALIVGLRLIGVEVHVYSHTIRMRRMARTAERAETLVSQAA